MGSVEYRWANRGQAAFPFYINSSCPQQPRSRDAAFRRGPGEVWVWLPSRFLSGGSAKGLPSVSFIFLGGLANVGKKKKGHGGLFNLTHGGKGVGSLVISSSAARILTSKFRNVYG